jgi:hypothetical protein
MISGNFNFEGISGVWEISGLILTLTFKSKTSINWNVLDRIPSLIHSNIQCYAISLDVHGNYHMGSYLIRNNLYRTLYYSARI